MARPSYRHAWAEVDLAAVRHNVRTVAAAAAPAAVCAVVKADGYGHGAVQVALAAAEAGAQWLAVALVEEGVSLREAGIAAPILLLSEAPDDAAAEVLAHHLTPTVYSARGVDAIAAAAARAGRRIGVHLKVDTGMHRVGADAASAAVLAQRIDADAQLSLDALWSHLAVADDPSQDEVTAAQRERFDAARAAIAGAGVRVAATHLANSAGTLYTGAHHDMVRAGIALYGYAPDPARPAGLRPALSLRARVSFVKELEAGERLSYGLRYEVPERSVIATVPLGYADGVPRRLSGAGATVLVGGRHRPIVGTITMDQLLVDCGPGAAVEVGDEVVLLGSQWDATITADDWAGRSGTISYEILCGIGGRVPRVYVG